VVQHSDAEGARGAAHNIHTTLQVVLHNCSIDFLPDAKYMIVVEKSASADILGEVAKSYIAA